MLKTMLMRCFIGIDLPPPLKTEVVTWRDTYWPDAESSKPVPACNLHMTLLFIPALSLDVQKSFIEKLDVSCIKPFTLHLDYTNHWQKPAIAWLSALKPSVELLTLQKSISQQCSALGIASPDLIRSYQPHVTLLRKFKSLTKYPQPPKNWQCRVEQVHLFESHSGANGVRYPIVETWTLGEENYGR